MVISDGVERDPPSHAEVPEAGLLKGDIDDMYQGVLELLLDFVGKVHQPRSEVGLALTVVVALLEGSYFQEDVVG